MTSHWFNKKPFRFLITFAVFYCSVALATNEIVVLDSSLPEEPASLKAKITEKKPPIYFSNGKSATNCKQFMALSKNLELADKLSNRLHASEYLGNL
ncbi:MAG: hypothetical protein HC848_09165 [Limnobacter sp.]|nr:hypothetical protein [Limnobacter sp.]